jgi:hypothetical protein
MGIRRTLFLVLCRNFWQVQWYNGALILPHGAQVKMKALLPFSALAVLTSCANSSNQSSLPSLTYERGIYNVLE